ncbi:MAG: VanZ family protein [Pseudomonadota bacterium]
MKSSAMPKHSSPPRWALALTVLIALGITWGTLKPPGSGGGSFPLTDKQIHALAFALLVLPLSFAAPRLIPKLIITALVFGAMIEVVQPSFGRTGEWEDWLADAIGIAVGILPGLWRQRRHNIS